MNICGRCDRWIQPGEKYTTHDMPSPSGAGMTVYRHVKLCRRPPTQTAPAQPVRRRISR